MPSPSLMLLSYLRATPVLPLLLPEAMLSLALLLLLRRMPCLQSQSRKNHISLRPNPFDSLV